MTFNKDEIAEQLRPYVTSLTDRITDKGNKVYNGFYKNSPIFQIGNKNIQILRWGHNNFFHTYAYTAEDAIPVINEAIMYLKGFYQTKRLWKLEDDF